MDLSHIIRFYYRDFVTQGNLPNIEVSTVTLPTSTGEKGGVGTFFILLCYQGRFLNKNKQTSVFAADKQREKFWTPHHMSISI